MMKFQFSEIDFQYCTFVVVLIVYLLCGADDCCLLSQTRREQMERTMRERERDRDSTGAVHTRVWECAFCYKYIIISLDSPSSLSRLTLADSVCTVDRPKPSDSMENLMHVQRLNELNGEKNRCLDMDKQKLCMIVIIIVISIDKIEWSSRFLFYSTNLQLEWIWSALSFIPSFGFFRP